MGLGDEKRQDVERWNREAEKSPGNFRLPPGAKPWTCLFLLNIAQVQFQNLGHQQKLDVGKSPTADFDFVEHHWIDIPAGALKHAGEFGLRNASLFAQRSHPSSQHIEVATLLGKSLRHKDAGY